MLVRKLKFPRWKLKNMEGRKMKHCRNKLKISLNPPVQTTRLGVSRIQRVNPFRLLATHRYSNRLEKIFSPTTD